MLVGGQFVSFEIVISSLNANLVPLELSAPISQFTSSVRPSTPPSDSHNSASDSAFADMYTLIFYLHYITLNWLRYAIHFSITGILPNFKINRSNFDLHTQELYLTPEGLKVQLLCATCLFYEKEVTLHSPLLRHKSGTVFCAIYCRSTSSS